MANLQARYDRSGKLISYSVRVYRGRDLSSRQLKPYCTTFRVQPTWSEATARKRAQQFADIFEQRCKQGEAADARLTFAEYSEEILRRKEKAGILKRMEQKYALPHLNPHAFRHGLASALLYQGVDPVTVSRHLGHAQVSTTENIYAHVLTPSQDRMQAMLETIYDV